MDDPALDPERLARLRAGDPDAVRVALRELLPHVRRWLVRLIGRSPDLDDATQDALTEIARFLPRFEGRSKLSTAAHRITVRVAYRYFKSARAEEAIDDDLVDHAPSAFARLEAREALARLQRCLAKLPAKRRVAFSLCAIGGMTPSEAAKVAGTTALAMRCRLVWARREIARMLQGDPYLAIWLRAEQEAA
jgi:RNA polymerase sigma-70 factor (ECF subfamily)